MKKRARLISLFVFTILVLTVFLLFTFVRLINQNRPEKLLASTIDKNIISAKTEIGDSSVSLATSVIMSFKDVTISIKNKKFLSAKECNVSIPYLSFLMSYGENNITCKFLRLEKSFFLLSDFLKPTLIKSEDGTSSYRAFKLPDILADNKTNLKLINTKLSFSNFNFIIDKVLLKNLNLSQTTAVEVSSYLNIKEPLHNTQNNKVLEKTVLSSNIIGIGEISLNRLLASKNIESSVLFLLDSTSWKGQSIPRSKHQVDLKYLKNGMVSLKVRDDFDSSITGQGQFNFYNNTFTATNLNYQLDSKLIKKFLPKEANTEIGGLLEESKKVLLLGGVQYNLSSKEVSLNLKLKSLSKENDWFLQLNNENLDFKLDLSKSKSENIAVDDKSTIRFSKGERESNLYVSNLSLRKYQKLIQEVLLFATKYPQQHSQSFAKIKLKREKSEIDIFKSHLSNILIENEKLSVNFLKKNSNKNMTYLLNIKGTTPSFNLDLKRTHLKNEKLKIVGNVSYKSLNFEKVIPLLNLFGLNRESLTNKLYNNLLDKSNKLRSGRMKVRGISKLSNNRLDEGPIELVVNEKASKKHSSEKNEVNSDSADNRVNYK